MSALDDVIKFAQKHESFVGPGVYLSDKAAAELAELRAKLEHAKDLLDQFASLSAKAEFWLENNPASRVMTEAEYKDYLSEQNRIKRQEEEQR